MLNFVKSEPGQDPIIVESYFAVTPARMFEAWTNPEIVKKWFGYKANSLHSAEIDLRQGGAWRFVISSDTEKSVGFEGDYLEIEPSQRLVFSWSHVVSHASGEREETPASKVEVTFAPKGSGTHILLRHSGVGTEDARKGIGGGWESSFGVLSNVFAEV